MIPYGKQEITHEDLNSVKEILSCDYITQGPTVSKFEEKVSKAVNANFAVAVNSATSALHLACLALKLKAGDNLWTVPISFVASANCGRYCNANVDFVDIDIKTGLISIEKLQEKLRISELNDKLPKILVVVHLAGSSCDMKKIYQLSTKYNFKIIEDASHALGGSYYDYPVGSCKYSDITIFSFHPVKIITTGEGGIATTNNSLLAQTMRDLRSHGIIREESRLLEEKTFSTKYEQQILGFNYRLTDIHAALGISQLKRLTQIVKKRNAILNSYKKLLADMPIEFLKIPDKVYSSVHLCVILLGNEKKQSYPKIFSQLRGNGIGVQLHYYPIHLQPYYKKLGFKEGDFPASEDYSSRALSIPLYPSLTKSEITIVVKNLSDILRT